MKELTILISWYKESNPEKVAAFEENRKTFYTHNPDAEVVTVINQTVEREKAWRCPDISLFDWYIKNGDANNSKRYLFVEWDSWCDCSMQEYFDKVWNCEVVAPSVKYIERDEWYWFKTINDLPEEVRVYATGIVPFCGTLLSNIAMQKICDEILKPKYHNAISELRLGTIATMLNLDPIPNPVCNRSLNWKDIGPLGIRYKGIHHPRKVLN